MRTVTTGTAGGGSLAGQTIKIGVVEPLTGMFASFGKSGVAGVKLAADEINASGGILGANIELHIEDYGADASVATTATQKLINSDKVIAIMGAFSSSAMFAMGAVTEKSQIPFVAIGGSADALVQQGWKYFFSISPKQTTFNQVVLKFLELVVKPTTIALVNENTLMGQDAARATERDVTPLGWKVTDKEFYTAGGLDYRSMLLKIKATNPDVVIFSSYLTDLVLLMQQSHEIDLNPKAFASTGGAGSQIGDFTRMAGKDSEYMISGSEYSFDRMWPDAAAIQNLSAKLQQQYGVPADFQSGSAYTHFYLLADAIAGARSLDPTVIRNQMALTNRVTKWWGWNKYNSVGQSAAPNNSLGIMQPIAITQVQKGNYVTVWPPEFAAGTVVYPMPAWSQRT
jgi:branched-chain amino acid transport system substrate-binding protein